MANERQHREGIPEGEGEHDRESDGGPIPKAEGNAEHHPEHLTDRATRQTVDGGAQRGPVERDPMSHRVRLTGEARYACVMTSS